MTHSKHSQWRATACIRFKNNETRGKYEHLPVVVQGWAWHRLQDVTELAGTLRSIPVGPDLVVHISYRMLTQLQDDGLEVLDVTDDGRRVVVVMELTFENIT